LIACALAWPLSASAQQKNDESSVLATLRCMPRVGKGRVVCDVEITAKSGRLTWADAIITQAPDFAPPLRDRVSMREASERNAALVRLPFALIAQQVGTGEVTISARTVWCKPAATRQELCVTVSHTVVAPVLVTPASG
jgi:hypothetical protein